jgi:hypothetical protein
LCCASATTATPPAGGGGWRVPEEEALTCTPCTAHSRHATGAVTWAPPSYVVYDRHATLTVVIKRLTRRARSPLPGGAPHGGAEEDAGPCLSSAQVTIATGGQGSEAQARPGRSSVPSPVPGNVSARPERRTRFPPPYRRYQYPIPNCLDGSFTWETPCAPEAPSRRIGRDTAASACSRERHKASGALGLPPPPPRRSAKPAARSVNL